MPVRNHQVYIIQNTVNNRVYVGASAYARVRKVQHFSDLNCQRHHNEGLQADYNQYGKSAFNHLIIGGIKKRLTASEAKELETFWIAYYGNRAYNTIKVSTLKIA